MGDQESQLLNARVVELETELADLRRRHEELATLTDRIVVMLRTVHQDQPQILHDVEQAAEVALSPD